MERVARHAGVDLYQAGAGPLPHSQIGHEEVRPLTLARAEGEAGRKVEQIRRKYRNRLLRQVLGVDANDRRPGQHGHIEVAVHVEGDAVPTNYWI